MMRLLEIQTVYNNNQSLDETKLKEHPQWKALPQNVRKAILTYGSETEPSYMKSQYWHWKNVDLEWLINEVWKHHDKTDDMFHHKNFDEYHKWYGTDKTRLVWAKKNPNSIWPIIIGGPPGGPYVFDEVILDGWHRFHYYVDHYTVDQLIPVVWASD